LNGTLRGGLCFPQRELDPATAGRLRAFLDGQRRIHLAAWVGHEHERPGGVADYDDHLLLGIDDADWQCGDLRALDLGLSSFELPAVHAWIDLFALRDAETVRETAVVLWEREPPASPELDPLDYRITWAPLELEAGVAAAFAELVRGVPGVVRIEAGWERLWKGETERLAERTFFVEFDERQPQDFEQLKHAMREAGIDTRNFAMTAALPAGGEQTAVLYER
jgi:hypothetical protein